MEGCNFIVCKVFFPVFLYVWWVWVKYQKRLQWSLMTIDDQIHENSAGEKQIPVPQQKINHTNIYHTFDHKINKTKTRLTVLFLFIRTWFQRGRVWLSFIHILRMVEQSVHRTCLTCFQQKTPIHGNTLDSVYFFYHKPIHQTNTPFFYL